MVLEDDTGPPNQQMVTIEAHKIERGGEKTKLSQTEIERKSEGNRIKN